MRNGKSNTTITILMVCYQMDIPDSRSKSSFILCIFTCSRVMPFYFDGKWTSNLWYKRMSEIFLSFLSFSVRKDLSGLDDVTLTSQSECGGEIEVVSVTFVELKLLASHNYEWMFFMDDNPYRNGMCVKYLCCHLFPSNPAKLLWSACSKYMYFLLMANVK